MLVPFLMKYEYELVNEDGKLPNPLPLPNNTCARVCIWLSRIFFLPQLIMALESSSRSGMLLQLQEGYGVDRWPVTSVLKISLLLFRHPQLFVSCQSTQLLPVMLFLHRNSSILVFLLIRVTRRSHDLKPMSHWPKPVPSIVERGHQSVWNIAHLVKACDS